MPVVTVSVVAYQLPLGDCNVFRQAPSGDADASVDTELTQPGCIVGYEHGTYTDFDVKGLRGSAAQPIELIPLADTGRLVTYAAGSADANMRNNQHAHMDGSGVTGETYGFVWNDRLHWYDNAGSSEETGNIEINNVDIDISATTDKIGLKFSPRSAFKIENVEIHNCRVSSEASTGMYIGEPHWDSHPGTEEMGGVVVRNCIVYNVESGIEFKGVVSGTNAIHHHTVYDINSGGAPTQEGGIYHDEGTTVKTYNNTVYDSEGYGISAWSDRAGQEIYNNLVYNCGFADPTHEDAIRVHSNVGGTAIEIVNNTIVTVEDHGIHVSNLATNVTAFNNIVIDCGALSIDEGGSPGGQFYTNDRQEDGPWTRADYGFVDEANDDFHLLVTANAVGTGTKAGSPTDDLDDVVRGDPPDKGAYEYVP